jgi:hypothetical protein
MTQIQITSGGPTSRKRRKFDHFKPKAVRPGVRPDPQTCPTVRRVGHVEETSKKCWQRSNESD